MNRYTLAAREIRKSLPPEPGLRDIVRFASLAANSHNTQPWKFLINEDTVNILPDFLRSTPAVDPDDHHLYISLGCAAENLVVAARASGRSTETTTHRDEAGDTFIRIALGEGEVTDTMLSDAIPKRQSTRSEYDGTTLSDAELDQLAEAATREGVHFHLITQRMKLDQALEFIQVGNAAQMDDPAFVDELKSWIRFSSKTSIEKADGLSAPSTGNPSSPDWLGPIVFGFAFRKKAETAKLARHLASSAGLVVFVADDETPEGWINVGRSFERFALMATALGLCHAHMNMPIEAASIRPEFAKWLGIEGRRPDLVVRFGRGEPMPMSLRRPVEDVIVA
ncbi:nitroreductase family protein [Yoonia maricola]|uniref:Nitroreductase family protein n=1 Tax=Yoonia maricola TaxID=420999 RepID=A0A2M8WMD7_9RHOB|nr:nitroreductase family protein [Yoonia maricola]PJI92089.1 nitroreductase family protein [Yoonia maricola]